MSEQHHHRGGLIWPIILIGAGVVFLLNNLNLLSWSVWPVLASLWPVLLIAIGLDILIGRRSWWGSLVIALLLLGVLVAVVVGAIPRGTARTAAGRTETISESLGGATRADVEIGCGIGSLQVGVLPESGGLVQGTVELGPNESLDRRYETSGGTAQFRLKSRDAWLAPTWNNSGDRRWSLDLNRDVPMQLRIETGVGSATLDLSRLNLTELGINTGVGRTSVMLPRQGRFTANINTGVGEISVTIPEGMAARIRVDRGLGAVTVNGDFDRHDNEYITPGYNTAENRADIKINGGLGQIVIRQAVE